MEGQKTSDALRILLDDNVMEGAVEPQLVAKHRVWVPRWLSKLIKYYLLPFAWLDIFSEKIAKKIIKPPFKQVGSCKKRGKCCHYILLPHRKGFAGRLAYWWYTQIHGFFPRFSDAKWYRGKKIHVMGCSFLKKDGSCGQYSTRPILCRKWPFIERFAHPEILRGCGFSSSPSVEEGMDLDNALESEK
ncbi:hypothetical protein COB21_05615 [Candidatus Aerophobetes bacterium]|uniref:YkgJ family cysteine cluster protein n=1 Tax=Aerophobetes bacterium TaxID=2030807 RepID=A0A2A4X094_UNCAE|nr:MAG: hypothetical protein COB21_05615 [Candidatus Aerophobetes bacterium]